MKSIKQIAWGLILLGLLPLAMSARSASVVQVEALGKTWDVAYVYGTWLEHEALLTSQPWWELGCCGEGSVQEFVYEADAAGIDLANGIGSAPWFDDSFGSFTPFFAWGEVSEARIATAMSFGNLWLDGNVHVVKTDSVFWGMATPHAVPIPGTLGLLGIAVAGLGLVRRKAT